MIAVTVPGTGKASSLPDTCTVEVLFQGEDQRIGRVREQIRTSYAALTQSLGAKAEVSEKFYQESSGLNDSSEWSCSVTLSAEIVLKNLDTLPVVVRALEEMDPVGALISVKFALSDSALVSSIARAKALAAAQASGHAYAEALGLKTVEVRAIHEQSHETRLPSHDDLFYLLQNPTEVEETVTLVLSLDLS